MDATVHRIDNDGDILKSASPPSSYTLTSEADLEISRSEHGSSPSQPGTSRQHEQNYDMLQLESDRLYANAMLSTSLALDQLADDEIGRDSRQ